MSTKVAQAALDAERAAREAEGYFDPTPEQAKMLRRHAALVERESKIKAEREAIEAMIESDLAEKGARALTVNGKNLVLVVPVRKTVVSVDTDRMAEQFPEIVAAYSQYVEIVPQFTTKVMEPNGFRVNYR